MTPSRRLTALYVATKVEEWNIDLVSFVSPFQLAPDAILRAELVLLHALRFQLVVWHALRPIVALTHELRDRALADADTVRAEATAAYMALLTTDVPLLHAPSVVALACVRAARPAAVDALIEERLRAQHPDVNLRAVTSDIIAQLEHARAPPDQERVRKADLKVPPRRAHPTRHLHPNLHSPSPSHSHSNSHSLTPSHTHSRTLTHTHLTLTHPNSHLTHQTRSRPHSPCCQLRRSNKKAKPAAAPAGEAKADA